MAGDFCREPNSLTDEKFRSLRWFTNKSRRPDVLLLLDAVLDEVKGHFPHYSPKIERYGLSDVELIGAYYHHLYDYLYVVIYNAAKHGRPDGRLLEEINFTSVSQRQRLEVIIASEIKPSDNIEHVKQNVTSALSGSIEDAMVVEGRSGIKKLLRMSSDVKEIKSINVGFEGQLVRFSCVIELDK